MSLEQAILEHAGALKELAAAIRSTVGQVAQISVAGAADKEAVAETNPAREAINTALAAAHAGADKAGKKTAEVKPDAELEKAVSKVEEDAGAELKSAKGGPLTYTADVLPLLMKLNKTKGKDALVALLGHFEAAKGDKIKPAQFADVIAYAEEKLAA